MNKYIQGFKLILLLLAWHIGSFNSVPIYAGSQSSLETVYLVPNPFIGLSLTQRYEQVNSRSNLWIRDFAFRLNISPAIELSILFPYINTEIVEQKQQDRLGDVVVQVNYASTTFKKYLLVNWVYGFNFGSGPDFREPDTHPLESYGQEEFRFGWVLMKPIGKWAFNGELSYYFRTKNKKEDMFRGFALNPFEGDTWQRWFGFNPNRKENFFYREKLKNDNLIVKFGVSESFTYPFVIFSFLDFRHDFIPAEEFGSYEKVRVPGVFSSPLYWVNGVKWFTEDEEVHFQLFVRLAANPDAWLYSRVGIGLGVYTEF